MREDPGLGIDKISACLDAHYGLGVASVSFLPIGHNPGAAVYKVIADDGISYFLKVRFGTLKVRFGTVHEPSLLVPRALIDLGVRNVVAPLRKRSSGLWCLLDGHPGYTAVLYPFVRGDSAMAAGLSDDQWREFGSTLRDVHAGGLGERLRGRLPVEAFSLPAAAAVHWLLTMVGEMRFESAAAPRLAEFWRGRAGQIGRMVARAEALGGALRSRPFEYVLCHADIHVADIHVADILVDDDGRIRLIDWDGPLVAPKERDLLFVVGSKIARTVEPGEEALFFEGYGRIGIDPDALVYYRYERIIEDLGEFGKSVFLDPSLGEQGRSEEADLAMGPFAPGGMVELAETVVPVGASTRAPS